MKREAPGPRTAAPGPEPQVDPRWMQYAIVLIGNDRAGRSAQVQGSPTGEVAYSSVASPEGWRITAVSANSAGVTPIGRFLAGG